MAVETRPELVGKRFLCLGGEEPPESGRWRAGVIRAVSQRDSHSPDLAVRAAARAGPGAAAGGGGPGVTRPRARPGTVTWSRGSRLAPGAGPRGVRGRSVPRPAGREGRRPAWPAGDDRAAPGAAGENAADPGECRNCRRVALSDWVRRAGERCY